MSSVYGIIPPGQAKIELFSRCDARLTTFPRISRSATVTTVDVSKNPIKSFEGMVEMPELEMLNISETEIKSFLGALALPSLKVLQMDHTPLAMYQHVQLMAAIVFGEGVARVNKKNVLKNEARLAVELRETLFDQLVEGWIITSVQPIRLFNTITLKRKVVYKVENIDRPMPGLDSLLPQRTDRFTPGENFNTSKVRRRTLKPLTRRPSQISKSTNQSASTTELNETQVELPDSSQKDFDESPISSPEKAPVEEKHPEEEQHNEEKEDLSKLSIEQLLQDSEDDEVKIEAEQKEEQPEHKEVSENKEEEEKNEETTKIEEEIKQEEKKPEEEVKIEEEKQVEIKKEAEEVKKEENELNLVPEVHEEFNSEDNDDDDEPPVNAIAAFLNQDSDDEEKLPNVEEEEDKKEEEIKPVPEIEEKVEQKEEPKSSEKIETENLPKSDTENKQEENPKIEEEHVVEEKQAEDIPQVTAAVDNDEADDEGLPKIEDDEEGLPNIDDGDDDIINPDDLETKDSQKTDSTTEKKDDVNDFFDAF
ncbi:hypothetical protein TVAG_484750 [Trichomonas vaginalis G3]|uniref:Uncharacterized protein n=1 Tax=Trichomonas vaginalis (strain ATCC PRA-98 / G3) TaxID=412133 RepID=A2G7R6_TRIV3|nr:ribonuclease inhibitor domain-containing protein [Trichomonas vaginalis G3]EAX86799.1 hypothetical protein TVAG_484750 [Trichomonas vaginalis G3]KAI5539061.1 ribonuclease inhibitor domain-containing protein [Trichomonas vaginalis G3]|eukprot:XP_001299729.1 hypothetical protein [Trichomonas vaginalis G3]